MKFNIKGCYTITIPVMGMFLNSSIKIKNDNIITTLGEAFFLTRMISDESNPLRYIVLGNASNKPKKSDMSLGNETVRKLCTKSVDLNKKQIILTCNFPVKEIYGTSEIGVHNGDVLISHDIYTKLDDNVLTPTAGDVEVEYVFNLSTGNYKTGWELATEVNNVYYVVEPNNVSMVFEESGMGYKRVNSKTQVSNNPGSYYYDTTLKNLYVRTIDDTHPDNHELIVQTR